MLGYNMLKDLQEFLIDKIKLKFREAPETPESYIPPRIYIDRLPAKRDKPNENFPFVVLRLRGGRDALRDVSMMHTFNVDLICGIFVAGPDESSADIEAGIEDIFTLTDKVRLELLKGKVLNQRWDVSENISWETFFDNPTERASEHPYYHVKISLEVTSYVETEAENMGPIEDAYPYSN